MMKGWLLLGIGIVACLCGGNAAAVASERRALLWLAAALLLLATFAYVLFQPPF